MPARLRSAGYEPFVQTIRACLRHAGGLRIDHVMGLFRLFWIPDGMRRRATAPTSQSDASDLLAIVALESQRARAVIVGEDLGTVEESAREQLAAHDILSYRLLWFEKTRPAQYPENALAAITTHDLPTVAGLWSGSDLDVQKELGLSPNEAGTREIRQRVQRMTRATASAPPADVVARVHEALARAPSRILTATLDDAMAVEERPNMPATNDEWPNWRLALPQPIETLKTSRLAKRIARALAGVFSNPYAAIGYCECSPCSSCSPLLFRQRAPLTVSAAVSLTEALEEVAAAYPHRRRGAGGLQLRRLERAGAADRQRRTGRRVRQRRRGADGRRRPRRADRRRAPVSTSPGTRWCSWLTRGRSIRTLADLGNDERAADRDWRSGSGAGRCLRQAIPRGHRLVGTARAEDRADDERSRGADRGAERQRGGGVRLRHRRQGGARAQGRRDHRRRPRAAHRLSGVRRPNHAGSPLPLRRS